MSSSQATGPPPKHPNLGNGQAPNGSSISGTPTGVAGMPTMGLGTGMGTDMGMGSMGTPNKGMNNNGAFVGGGIAGGGVNPAALLAAGIDPTTALGGAGGTGGGANNPWATLSSGVAGARNFRVQQPLNHQQLNMGIGAGGGDGAGANPAAAAVAAAAISSAMSRQLGQGNGQGQQLGGHGGGSPNIKAGANPNPDSNPNPNANPVPAGPGGSGPLPSSLPAHLAGLGLPPHVNGLKPPQGMGMGSGPGLGMGTAPHSQIPPHVAQALGLPPNSAPAAAMGPDRNPAALATKHAADAKPGAGSGKPKGKQVTSKKEQGPSKPKKSRVSGGPSQPGGPGDPQPQVNGGKISGGPGDSPGVKQYRDYSRVPPDEDDIAGTGGGGGGANGKNFPQKLHEILSRDDVSDIVSWAPHGRSWRVLKAKAFEERIIPIYFRHGKYNSFTRQVNGWGFKRITQGPDHNSYYHEFFLRGLPHLCKKMRRLTATGLAKADACSRVEPDFYRISKISPLPPGPPSSGAIRGGGGLSAPGNSHPTMLGGMNSAPAKNGIDSNVSGGGNGPLFGGGATGIGVPANGMPPMLGVQSSPGTQGGEDPSRPPSGKGKKKPRKSKKAAGVDKSADEAEQNDMGHVGSISAGVRANKENDASSQVTNLRHPGLPPLEGSGAATVAMTSLKQFQQNPAGAGGMVGGGDGAGVLTDAFAGAPGRSVGAPPQVQLPMASSQPPSGLSTGPNSSSLAPPQYLSSIQQMLHAQAQSQGQAQGLSKDVNAISQAQPPSSATGAPFPGHQDKASSTTSFLNQSSGANPENAYMLMAALQAQQAQAQQAQVQTQAPPQNTQATANHEQAQQQQGQGQGQSQQIATADAATAALNMNGSLQQQLLSGTNSIQPQLLSANSSFQQQVLPPSSSDLLSLSYNMQGIGAPSGGAGSMAPSAPTGFPSAPATGGPSNNLQQQLLSLSYNVQGIGVPQGGSGSIPTSAPTGFLGATTMGVPGGGSVGGAGPNSNATLSASSYADFLGATTNPPSSSLSGGSGAPGADAFMMNPMGAPVAGYPSAAMASTAAGGGANAMPQSLLRSMAENARR